MTEHYFYRGFGLSFASVIPMPSIGPMRRVSGQHIDVTVDLGRVHLPDGAVTMGDLTIAVSGDAVLVAIEEVGRFSVVGGRRIVVDRDHGVADDELLLFLLGSVFGIILYQRGYIPFHCNAVEMNGRAILFCGDSGAGKSTLAAFLEMRGHRLLTDDVCPVMLQGPTGAITASPGLARLKLWGESLELLGRERAGLRQLPWKVDKYEMPLADDRVTGDLPVGAVYHLRDDSDGRVHGIHRLAGLDAVNAVTANIYRRRIGDLMGLGAIYLAGAVRIARDIPIYSVNRKWGLSHFEAEALAAERHMGSSSFL